MTLEKIQEKLWQIPPDFEALRELTLSHAEALQLMYEFTDQCWCETLDCPNDPEATYDEFLGCCNQLPIMQPGMNSSHLYEVTDYLLQHGLDLNYEKDEN